MFGHVGNAAMTFRLRHVLTLAFVLISTVPVVLLGTWVEQSVMDREMATVSEKHLLLAQNLTRGLDRYAEDSKSVFTFLSATAGTGAPTAAAVELARRIGFRHFCFLDAEGRVHVNWKITDDGRKQLSPGIKRRLLVAARDEPAFSNVMADANGRPTLFLTQRLVSGRTAVAALGLDYIRQSQKSIAFGRKGHAAIVDRSGNVIAHPREDWERQIKNISKVKPVAEMMRGQSGVTTFFAPAVNMDMVTGYTTVPSTGWGVMVPQPIEELEDVADQVHRMAIGVVTIGFIAAALISWLLAGLLTGPVRAAIAAAQDLAKGNFDTQVPAAASSAPAEFQELEAAFNRMAQDVAAASRQRDQAEQEYAHALFSADRASRAKSAFLANMSHELRSPLNSIIGFSDMMNRKTWGPLGDDRYVEYVAGIERSGQHLLAIINDILDLSKIEAGETAVEDDEINIGETVNDCLTMLATSAHEGGVRLQAVVPEDFPRLRADQRHVAQIILNLVSNAIKFTPSGGRVTVGAYVRPGAGIQIAVTDTGVGIAEEDVSMILLPFSQVAVHKIRGKRDGTGLGLPICKSLMELHGGSLSIDSKDGHGTAVVIAFPAERTIAAE